MSTNLLYFIQPFMKFQIIFLIHLIKIAERSIS